MTKKTISDTNIVVVIIMVAFISSMATYFITNINKSDEDTLAKTVSIDYGDTISEFDVQSLKSLTLQKLPKSTSPIVVAYLSDSCKSCIEVVKNFKRLQSIFGNEKLTYIILWENNIPTNLIEKYDIDKQICFSLKGKTKFSTTTPTFYLVDTDQKVIFLNTDPQLLIEKLVSLNIIPKNILIKNANQFIINNLLPKDSKKQQLIYFAMKGCPDCAAANPIIEAKTITAVYDVTKIYKYDDTDESHIKDVYAIFKNIYGIKWYPSFLIIRDNTIKIIGETPLDQLQNEILTS